MPTEATVPAKGPLYGTELCTKPLIYVIYPLCEPVFLVSGLPSSALVPVLGGLGSLINPFEQTRAPFCVLGYWATQVCPLYNFPLVLGFFAALVTVINLILPETQPDEDLRVG